MTELVGVHVKKTFNNDNEIYRIPLCQEYNLSTAVFYVKDGYFVSADKSKTCEKKYWSF